MDEIILLNQLEIVENAEEMVNISRRDFWLKWQKEDPLEFLTDKKFIKTFRLSKIMVVRLLEEIGDYLTPPTRASALTKKIKVLVALNFFATGSYQTDIGLNKFVAISQSSVSRSITEVTNALNMQRVFGRWVHFPENIEEINNQRREFYEEFGIPGIIGVIDCTHVAIFPPRENEHIYVNRKQYHSINTQLICKANLSIINVNARFPGSTHDAYIWNNSNVNNCLRQLNRRHPNYYIIGDSGYPLRQWLQTPIRNPEPGTPEEDYNTAFCRARGTIERCNGLLKMRFRCLLKHRTLHYEPTMAAKIINACVVLHNMCISNNIPEPEVDEGDDLLDFGINFPYLVPDENAARNPDLEAGRRLQRQIIRNYFYRN